MPSSRPPSYFTNDSSFDRSHSRSVASKQILIVTEGVNTEPIYLEELAQYWNLHPHVTHIEPGGEGIPENLVTKAIDVQRERREEEEAGKLPYNLAAEFDETWIVIDAEHALRQNKLETGLVAAKANGFKIAHCHPCFEFWLALHFELKARPMNTCSEACRLLEEVAGMKKNSYSKQKGASQNFLKTLPQKVQTAVRNAKQLTGQQTDEKFPVNPSTSLHLLIRSLHETLPEQMKKRFRL